MKKTTMQFTDDELYILAAAMRVFTQKTSDDVQAQYKMISDEGRNIPSDLIAANTKYSTNMYRLEQSINQTADAAYKAAFEQYQLTGEAK